MSDFNRNRNCLGIIKSVAGQLGLPVPTAVLTNTGDKLAQQLWWMLNEQGQRLIKPVQGYRWQVLKRTWQLTTDPAKSAYPPPDDWDSFIDSTAWNQTSQLPMAGASDQQWSVLKARSLGPTTINLIYRMRAGSLQLYYSPQTAQTLLIDYTSRAWVQRADGSYSDQLQSDDDMVLYDAELAKALLKLAFLQAKGFDTTVAQNDVDLALELAINADTDAPIVNAAGTGDFPLIGEGNLPETGYGA